MLRSRWKGAKAPSRLCAFHHMKLRKPTPNPKAEHRPVEGTANLGPQALEIVNRLPQTPKNGNAGR